MRSLPPIRRRRAADDRGSVLVLALILTVVLAIVVLSIARYVTTGLQTSEVTTERTETNASASAALTWAIEEFAAKRWQPTANCSTDDTVLPVPPGVTQVGTTTVTCSQLDEIGNHPTVELTAVTVADGTQRRIEVLLQVPRDDYNTQVASWNAT